MGLFAIGALQSEIRQAYRGEEREEFKLDKFISNAITNSAALGTYTWGMDIASVTGIFGGGAGSRYDPTGGLGALILGPGVIGFSGKSLGILSKMNKIMTDEDKQFTYNDLNYMANTAIPFYRWAPISLVVKPRLKEYFESIDRGGE